MKMYQMTALFRLVQLILSSRWKLTRTPVQLKGIPPKMINEISNKNSRILERVI